MIGADRFEAAPSRRTLLRGGFCSLALLTSGTPLRTEPNGVGLAAARIGLKGDWSPMLESSVQHVLNRMRMVCLTAVRLLCDGQPDALAVERRPSGPPAIWLHSDEPATARILVDIGERDWCKLAYQFGHELGHVLSNSWRQDAIPRAPCQWLEEALVEAFSLRGLALLAESWRTDPPFKNDAGFAAAILAYREATVSSHRALAGDAGYLETPERWFAAHRAGLEAQPFLSPSAMAASIVFLAEFERDAGTIEAMGALNRWPGRSGLTLTGYLDAWSASCGTIRADPSLPATIRQLTRLAQ